MTDQTKSKAAMMDARWAALRQAILSNDQAEIAKLAGELGISTTLAMYGRKHFDQ